MRAYTTIVFVLCKRPLRQRLDARKVNEVIEDICEKPIAIDEAIKRFHIKKWLSTMELTKGFYQIGLDKDSRMLTAFLIGGRQYQFKRLPFGLKISGQFECWIEFWKLQHIIM